MIPAYLPSILAIFEVAKMISLSNLEMTSYLSDSVNCMLVKEAVGLRLFGFTTLSTFKIIDLPASWVLAILNKRKTMVLASFLLQDND